jgi:hypothetical protein
LWTLDGYVEEAVLCDVHGGYVALLTEPARVRQLVTLVVLQALSAQAVTVLEDNIHPLLHGSVVLLHLLWCKRTFLVRDVQEAFGCGLYHYPPPPIIGPSLTSSCPHPIHLLELERM